MNDCNLCYHHPAHLIFSDIMVESAVSGAVQPITKNATKKETDFIPKAKMFSNLLFLQLMLHLQIILAVMVSDLTKNAAMTASLPMTPQYTENDCYCPAKFREC